MKPAILLITMIMVPALMYSQETGLVLVPEEEYQAIKSPPIQSGSGTLPARYVIPDHAFPRAGEQGAQPSCVGWALGFGYMSFYHAAKNKVRINGEENQFSPSYVYQSLRECGNCKCGTRIDLALEFLKNKGNVPIAHCPYNARECTRPDPDLAALAGKYKISDWFRIEDIKNLSEIKGYLANDMPVIVSVKADDAFSDFERKSESDTYYWRQTGDYENHAMIAVGYDDNRRAIKLLNSWGTDWGVNGYGWVDYKSFRAMVNQGFIVEKDYDLEEVVIPNNPSQKIEKSSFRPYAIKETIRKGRYYYTFGFDIDQQVLPEVSKIVYVYDHPSFSSKYATATKAPNYANSYEGWGCLNEMQAIVYLKDGTTLVIDFNACDLLEKSTSRPGDILAVNIRPTVTAEPDPDEEGRYYFHIQLRGIETVKNRVVKVVYDRNHPSFKTRFITTYDRENNFEGGYNGWGCLNSLGVTIHFDNNTRQTFQINMCRLLSW